MIRPLFVASLLVPLFIVSGDLYSEESLQQPTISILGNRGLPKTLYIAPWKKLGSPLEGGELDSALDEGPDVVEREVLRRELQLYHQGFSID